MPLSYRIDARDKANPVYYLDGREVTKQEFYRVIWQGSKFGELR